MSYVLCIDSGNGSIKGYPTPKKGVVYKVLREFHGETCRYNGKCSDVWYKLEGMNLYRNSSLIFESLPDDILNVKETNKELIKEPLWIT